MIKDSVIVITGATSGIGLCTARMAASRGARLVLTARNHEMLDSLVKELIGSGRQAVAISGDVAEPEVLEIVAAEAIRQFGRIDAWINNAGVSIYGRLTDVPLEEKRRLFDVNFWGIVHGSRAALPYLSRSSGTLVNLGSIASDRAIPLQGIYCASKHAIKAYSDCLRMELEADQVPVQVTLVKPGSVATPYPQHARSHLEVEPSIPAPLYHPELVAKTILRCIEKGNVREIEVGGTTRALSFLSRMFPRLTDLVMERAMIRMEKTSAPEEVQPDRRDSLFEEPFTEGTSLGEHKGRVHRRSAYTWARLHPEISTGALIAGVSGLGAAARFRNRLKKTA